MVDSVTEGWLHTDVDTTLLDHGTVSLIDGTGDLLEVVRVGDQLVAGEDVLLRGQQKKRLSGDGGAKQKKNRWFAFATAASNALGRLTVPELTL
mgnify:CR=1 FL=1